MATAEMLPRMSAQKNSAWYSQVKAEIKRAHPEDANDVLRLVEESHLTTEGLLEHLATTLVARLDQRIVGTAALEIHLDGALLRSVAVSPEVRGRGLGMNLVEAALSLAEDLRLAEVYLLTFTAERYFDRLGFRSVTRADVPHSVRRSVQFSSACPSSALVMRRKLRPPTQRS
jgi:amino-acid N-acetyltransferase